jgi:hypothetical protein
MLITFDFGPSFPCSVMPILTISFGLQYYDKAVIGSASVFGLIKDLVRRLSEPASLLLQRWETRFVWPLQLSLNLLSLSLQSHRTSRRPALPASSRQSDTRQPAQPSTGDTSSLSFHSLSFFNGCRSRELWASACTRCFLLIVPLFCSQFPAS